MASRRDYVAVAAALAKLYEQAPTDEHREGVRWVVRDLARTFSDHNPRFSAQRFYAACACGLDD
jgi:hypothetical protein